MDTSSTLHSLYVLAISFYLPSIIVAITHIIQKKHLIIRAPNLKINYTTKNWPATHFYAAAIWLSVILFTSLFALKHVARDLDFLLLSVGPVMLAGGGTLALANEQFKLAKYYEQHSKKLKTAAVISGIIVGYFANTYTNTTIAEYTLTNASNFPDAQKIVTLLTSLGIWIFIAIAICFAAHAVLALITLVNMIKHDGILRKQWRYHRYLLGTPAIKTARPFRQITYLAALLVGSTLTLGAPAAYLTRLKQADVDNLVKTLVVDSSFQLSPALCGVQTPAGSLMSLLPFRQAAVAVPDAQLTYRFSIIECRRTFDSFPPIPNSPASPPETSSSNLGRSETSSMPPPSV
ncbi:hypothetical protein [Pseudomonas soli]|uniref:hypothetical protein n=1 Tax=Pseudomonas soli TaxID=1306993 RepID=UPI0011B81DD0|nr:hypothetical protein [Pseudomonas soli]